MLGVPARNVYATLQTYLAGTYVNNINLLGHTFQVIAQGDADYRQDQNWIGRLQDALRLRRDGAASMRWQRCGPSRRRTACCATTSIPPRTSRVMPRPGYSSGEAHRRDGAPRTRAPAGRHELRVDRHGLPAADLRRCRRPGLRARAWSFVFIFLAALYESLTLPLAVILIVPMCLLAALTRREPAGAGQQHPDADRHGGARRARSEERDPDRRVRAPGRGEATASRRTQAADRGGAHAAATHPDDLGRLHLRRDPAGLRQRRRAQSCARRSASRCSTA